MPLPPKGKSAKPPCRDFSLGEGGPSEALDKSRYEGTLQNWAKIFPGAQVHPPQPDLSCLGRGHRLSGGLEAPHL